MTKKVGLQRIIFNIFQLTSTEAMSSYEGRFVKIGVVFDALYFENEVGDPPIFSSSDIGNSLSDCSQSMKKICIVEVFRANVLKWTILSPSRPAFMNFYEELILREWRKICSFEQKLTPYWSKTVVNIFLSSKHRN